MKCCPISIIILILDYLLSRIGKRDQNLGNMRERKSPLSIRLAFEFNMTPSTNLRYLYSLPVHRDWNEHGVAIY